MTNKLTDAQITAIRKHYAKSKNQMETAREMTEKLGTPITRNTVQYWCDISRVKVPLSENRNKTAKASPEEVIACLQEMAKANPDTIITRNMFRVNSHYAESAWNRHFGTFEEFKRQAGLKLTRGARSLELNVARHASVDTYRAMNIDKRDWGGKFVRPTSGRFQLVLIGSDIHDIDCDSFWREMFMEAAARSNPDVIVLNGDIFDLPEFGKYSVDPRDWNVVGRIRWVHKFLEDLRKLCPKATIHFIEGNHEYRLLRHLSEATPAMKAVLGDLHNWTVPKLLGLTDYEVNYHAPADLAVFTPQEAKRELKRNFLVLFDTVVAHHFPEGNRFGMPGWNGHHHSHEVRTYYGPLTGSYEWHQLGSGHKREASYTNGEKWGNGFMFATIDTEKRRAHFDYVDTTHDHCLMAGKLYHRG